MSSSETSDKVLCVVCNKGKGSLKCEGCLQTFCPKHVLDHRNELSKQLEEIETEHDQIKQTIMQQIENPHQHSLMNKVNQWEIDSLNKIRQKAEETRNKLLENTIKHTNDLQQKLEQLCNELRQARDDDDFIETDLRKWTKKIEELKIELVNPVNINIQEDSTPLVSNIYAGETRKVDIFERVCGNAQIEENGQLVVKTVSTGHTEIRGKSEYSSGRCTVYFRIEQLSENPWIFFGIISKSQAVKVNSFSSSSNYGWANANQVYVAGKCNNQSSCDAVENDTVMLLIDCDQRKIEFKNPRTNLILQMPVDINKCPFPWQIHLNLYQMNTRVRIVEVST